VLGSSDSGTVRWSQSRKRKSDCNILYPFRYEHWTYTDDISNIKQSPFHLHRSQFPIYLNRHVSRISQISPQILYSLPKRTDLFYCTFLSLVTSLAAPLSPLSPLFPIAALFSLFRISTSLKLFSTFHQCKQYNPTSLAPTTNAKNRLHRTR
jgi:hypothetical protein